MFIIHIVHSLLSLKVLQFNHRLLLWPLVSCSGAAKDNLINFLLRNTRVLSIISLIQIHLTVLSFRFQLHETQMKYKFKKKRK